MASTKKCVGCNYYFNEWDLDSNSYCSECVPLDESIIMVHLNHPCREIDIQEGDSAYTVKILKGQGYFSLGYLRNLIEKEREKEKERKTRLDYIR